MRKFTQIVYNERDKIYRGLCEGKSLIFDDIELLDLRLFNEKNPVTCCGVPTYPFSNSR